MTTTYDPRDALSRPPADRITVVRSPRPRSGHRREASPTAPRRNLHDRLNGALVDVSLHRAVAYRDVVDAHFGGHPYAARRGVDQLKRAGLVEEFQAKGPKGGHFSVLTATKGGAKLAAKLAEQRGFAPEQHAWSGVGKQADLLHDLAIYRATRDATAQLATQGAAVSRIRLDAEIRGQVNSRVERVRAESGRAAADEERRKAARELGLPLDDAGRVLYPDAQLEFSRSDGREPGRVNIEVATEHYSSASVAKKALAGFAVYAAGAKAGKTVSSGLLRAARALGKDDGGRGGRADRDPSILEL